MREYARRCKVRMPHAALWDYLADYGNVVRLGAPTAEATLLSGKPGVIGAKYRCVVEWEGLVSRYPVVLADADPNQSMTWKGRSPGISASLRFDLTPVDAGTTDVAANVTFSMGAAVAPLEPFAGALLDRMFEHMMRKLHSLQPGEPPEDAAAG